MFNVKLLGANYANLGDSEVGEVFDLLPPLNAVP